MLLNNTKYCNKGRQNGKIMFTTILLFEKTSSPLLPNTSHHDNIYARGNRLEYQAHKGKGRLQKKSWQVARIEGDILVTVLRY